MSRGDNFQRGVLPTFRLSFNRACGRGNRLVGVVLLLGHLACGCALSPNSVPWGTAGWPDGERFRQAAKDALGDPGTWAPLAGAVLLTVDDADDNVSEWAARRTPVFGGDAAGVSDDLRDVATVSYFITALLAPSETAGDKLRGLGVGVGTMLVEGALTTGLKAVTGRQRPNGRNDRSLPSGHSAQAASRTALARYNLKHIDMPKWVRGMANVTLYGVAAGAGWARVEAEKHHPSDVLVGYALGNFLARFLHHSFMNVPGGDGDDGKGGFTVGFQPVGDGGALTISVPVH